VEEGVVKWDLGRPYLIAQDTDGYCRHLDRKTSCCTIRDQRPLPCRGYDCRKDKRVWTDFEQMIINPDLDRLFAQAETERQEKSE
jgi:Fe-S-cluster containining protein